MNALYSLAYKQNMSVTSGYLSIWVVISSAAVFVALEKGLKIKKRKIDVIRNNKHKRNRRISVENEKFEHDVHAAALRFIQE